MCHCSNKGFAVYVLVYIYRSCLHAAKVVARLVLDFVAAQHDLLLRCVHKSDDALWSRTQGVSNSGVDTSLRSAVSFFNFYLFNKVLIIKKNYILM